MDLNEKYTAAQTAAKEAYDDLMQKHSHPDRFGMTVAEIIGLPRMWRSPWNTETDEITHDVVVMLRPEVLSLMRLEACSALESSYYIEVEAAQGSEFFAKYVDEQKQVRKLIRKNQHMIELEIANRERLAEYLASH